MGRTLIGIVSHVNRGSETTMSMSGASFGGMGKVSGSGSTWQILTFRIDGQPVQYKSKGTMPSLSDGDVAAAAGGVRGGTLHARAVRNVTTGAVYTGPWLLFIILGSILSLIGVATLIFLVGLLLLPIGIYATIYGILIKKAHISVSMASKPAAITTATN